jgi:hypothetical protein
MNRKAVALISGGLDSALAVHLVKRQGIEVLAVHFTWFFSSDDPGSADSPIMTLARQLEVPVVFLPKGDDFLEIIRNPRFGHGKNLNPCIDCRIYTFKKARAFMEKEGASFIVTGEVLGQRPMSQRRDAMRLIDRESGCEGLVLRPLSALALAPTLPEEAGIVDRAQLLGIRGRGRKDQLRLAQEIGLTGFQSPAGGCLLTDVSFSNRMRDLLSDHDEVPREGFQALTVGRHIRIRPGLRIVVGRNHDENLRLEQLAAAGILLYPIGFPGPTALVQGRPDPEEEQLIGGIIRRYAKPATRGESIGIRDAASDERIITVRHVAPDSWIAEHII